MQERTAFRLAMLRNGFQPLLNNCKRPIEKGWPKKIVTEAEVLSWDRSALASTGMKIDGDLAVIDPGCQAGGRPRRAIPGVVCARPRAPRRRPQGSLDRARGRTVWAARLASLVSGIRS